MNALKNMPSVERGSAKINLYLHVTGKREDGYHTLDSLVVFAHDGMEAADTVTLTPAGSFALSITGPQAGLLNQEDTEKNLITKALRNLGAKLGRALDFEMTLQKNLPVASGIGGGSADAAAALRVAARHWGIQETHDAVIAAAQETGADMLVCLMNRPCYMGGIGHAIEAAPVLPKLAMLLINPNIPLPTASVFKARSGPFHAPARLTPMLQNAQEFCAKLAQRTNDLEAPAIALCGAITDILDALRAQPRCLLARLSGSGATCFGLFETQDEAMDAANSIRQRFKAWWVAVSGF